MGDLLLKLVPAWSGESDRLVTRTYIEVGKWGGQRSATRWGNGKHAKHQHDIHTYAVYSIDYLDLNRANKFVLLCILHTYYFTRV